MNFARLILVSSLSVFALSGPTEAKLICLMLCPTDSALAQCKLSWDATGDCTCKCRGVEWDNIKSEIKAPASGSLSGIAVRPIDENTFGLNLVAKEAGPDGGGGNPPEKPDKPSPADVERLIRELLAACHLRGC